MTGTNSSSQASVAEVHAAVERYKKALTGNDIATIDTLFRHDRRTVIPTYGRDFAAVSTLFHRTSLAGKVGQQMQTWVRFAEGWRVVAAHVSIIEAPNP